MGERKDERFESIAKKVRTMKVNCYITKSIRTDSEGEYPFTE
jgi:hypothetical protein